MRTFLSDSIDGIYCCVAVVVVVGCSLGAFYDLFECHTSHDFIIFLFFYFFVAFFYWILYEFSSNFSFLCGFRFCIASSSFLLLVMLLCCCHFVLCFS